MTIKKIEFEHYLQSVNCCYAKEIFDKLPIINDFSKLFSKDEIEYETLLTFATNQSNIYLKSVSKRILALINIRHSRQKKGNEFDLRNNWNFIFDSIQNIPSSCTVSSIGSQGFLSIPLF